MTSRSSMLIPYQQHSATPADATAILALGILRVSAAPVAWEDSGDLCFFLILTPESGLVERDWVRRGK